MIRKALLYSMLAVAVAPIHVVGGNNPWARNQPVNHVHVRERYDTHWGTKNHKAVSMHRVHPNNIAYSSSMFVKAASYALGFSALVCGLHYGGAIEPSVSFSELIGKSVFLGWFTSYFDDHFNYHYVDANGNDLSSQSKEQQLHNSCRWVEAPEHMHRISDNGERQEVLVTHHHTRPNITPAPITKLVSESDSNEDE